MTSKTLRMLKELELKRGDLDGYHGNPPAALEGPYMDGYVQGKERRHREQITGQSKT